MQMLNTGNIEIIYHLRGFYLSLIYTYDSDVYFRFEIFFIFSFAIWWKLPLLYANRKKWVNLIVDVKK